ncbi:PREDICTED: appetite-regulating hormone-like [Gekko japonicus]|uniref:Appetite-regulating hormone n=1 Tax=Gekko japonicus TaxID=146911 RepID=A0ABM1L427_GEKJA|nr:PREDICTED: appetite-regulating hormone-like [Gekko japonicus]
MFLRTTVLVMLLVFLLWPETTVAGSSFLSPEQPKAQQRKPPPKPATKLHRRDAGAVLDVHRTEGDTDEIQIKVSEEQYGKYGQILEQFLEDILTEDTKVFVLLTSKTIQNVYRNSTLTSLDI